MTREIVFDTETTGLSPVSGDRVVEIGCVELINHVPTGKHFHQYINPERTMPEEAFRVHGLSDAFLSDKPVFSAILEEFHDFVGDATLVAHNAPFDMSFIHAEYERCRRPALRNQVIDTVEVARQRHPGARVSLDALCKHYGIDNSKRTLHGALLDSQILAEVYLELIGGRQVGLAFASESEILAPITGALRARAAQRPSRLPSRITEAERAAHAALIGSMGSSALWAEYALESEA